MSFIEQIIFFLVLIAIFTLDMSTFTHLSDTERERILALREMGMSIRKIAEKCSRSKRTIENLIKDPENYGKKPRSGRPPLVDERDKRRIKFLAINENISASQIRLNLSLPVSTRRVQQILQKSDNVSYEKKLLKPELLPRHKVARLQFANKYKFWDEEWKKIIFSDEKKFNLDGPDGYRYYYRDTRAPKKVHVSRNFHGGSLMVWAAFGYTGKSPICFVTHKMNAQNYVELLDTVLVQFGEDHFGEEWTFQQDNAPIHCAKHTKSFFSSSQIPLLEWPARSPDLNPIENLWGILSQKVYSNGRQFGTLKELKDAINQEWAKIDTKVLENLINSMPGRVLKVLNNKGCSI